MWTQARKAEVLQDWKDNKISLAEAARRLVQLGLTTDQAWALLEKK